MQFKSERLKNEWNDNRLSPLLKQIVSDAAEYARQHHNWEFTITSIFRTPKEDAELEASGVHTLWRAIDVRTKDQKPQAVNDAANYVNGRWIYDPLRPTMKVCFTEPHGNDVHAHFQIHQNTKLRKPIAAKVSETFESDALPLDENGVAEALEAMNVKAAELWTVIDVETYGCGFIPDRRPLILYERHWFSQLTKRKYDAKDPNISNKKAGGYGDGGANQYNRLRRAINFDRRSALRSTSWGIGQVMGFNYKIAGFSDVEEMVVAMTESENKQLLAMTRFVIENKLHKELRAHDWAEFARRYNGANYAVNKYDTRLAAAYSRRRMVLPDLRLRAAQVFLTFLDYYPGKIDGLPGPNTFSALNEFQTINKLPVKNKVDKKTLKILKEKASVGN